MEFKKKILDNGLAIIGEPNPAAQSAAIGFFVKTGARDEKAQVSGVSHFLEHMLFKGTNKLSAFEVNEAFDKTGAKFNAFTSEENTVYYAAVLPEHLLEVTGLWCQLMRPRLGDDDFNIEKNVIKQEIAMYKDLPQFDVMDRCKSLHFSPHPCGNSVLGTNESIDALEAEQMREYFNTRYAPNNISVGCSGNFDFDRLCRLISRLCGNWKPKEVHRQTIFFEGTKQKRREVNSTLSREHICLMSPAIAFQDERSYAGTLLAMIIGDDVGSRFFWALVDTAIAETATMHCEAMDGVGAFYSYISTSSESAERVMDKVKEIFASLSKDSVTSQELQKAKNKVLSTLTIKNEVPMGRLLDLGFNWTYIKKYRTIDEEIEKIKAVTCDDIESLIAELAPENFTRFSIGPGRD